MHGLPYQQDRVSVEWDQLIEHLGALEACGHPVRAEVRDADPTLTTPYLEAFGHLRLAEGWHVGPPGSYRAGVVLMLQWPEAGQQTARVAVYADLFIAGTLWTEDGDDYFRLTAETGHVRIAFTDSNTYGISSA